MSFKSKSTIKKEILDLQLENRELRDKIYGDCSRIGCYFCKHGLVLEKNGNVEVCCELTQKEYCKDYVRKDDQL